MRIWWVKAVSKRYKPQLGGLAQRLMLLGARVIIGKSQESPAIWLDEGVDLNGVQQALSIFGYQVVDHLELEDPCQWPPPVISTDILPLPADPRRRREAILDFFRRNRPAD